MEDVAAEVGIGVPSFFELFGGSFDADEAPHHALDGVAYVGDIELVEGEGLGLVGEGHGTKFAMVMEGGEAGALSGARAVDESFEEAIGGESIGAVEATA